MGGQDAVETLKQTYFQGYPESARCVQSSVDSRNSAIHSAYRISLRPSSLPEPRHPSLKVVKCLLERNVPETKNIMWLSKIGGSTREAPLTKLIVHPGNADRRGVDVIAARAAVPT